MKYWFIVIGITFSLPLLGASKNTKFYLIRVINNLTATNFANLCFDDWHILLKPGESCNINTNKLEFELGDGIWHLLDFAKYATEKDGNEDSDDTNEIQLLLSDYRKMEAETSE